MSQHISQGVCVSEFEELCYLKISNLFCQSCESFIYHFLMYVRLCFNHRQLPRWWNWMDNPKFPQDDTHNCCFPWQLLNRGKHPAVAPQGPLLKLSTSAPLSNEWLQSAVEPSNDSLLQLLPKSPIASHMLKQPPTAS